MHDLTQVVDSIKVEPYKLTNDEASLENLGTTSTIYEVASSGFSELTFFFAQIETIGLSLPLTQKKMSSQEERFNVRFRSKKQSVVNQHQLGKDQ